MARVHHADDNFGCTYLIEACKYALESEGTKPPILLMYFRS